MNIIKELAKLILKVELDNLNSEVTKKEESILNLKEEIKELTYSSPKEEYYNNKYPKIDKKYYKHLLGESISFDVRCFVGNYKNKALPQFKGTDDEIAIKALTWIIQNKKYASDKSTTGLVEYWNMSYETLLKDAGDCEDGGILLYDILRANGVPAWKIRVTVGWAINPFNGTTEGHAYVTYYSEQYDKWVALDWCYLPNTEKMETQPHYRDVSFYGDVWWSFNENYVWGRAK
jgi:hypothetical protein